MTALSLDRFSLFPDDLKNVTLRTRMAWETLRGQRILITGGTGFFGKWLLETFAHANEELELESELVVLSRDPHRFLNENAHVKSYESIRFHRGDVRNFDFPTGEFAYVIHAATDASAALNRHSPTTMFNVIADGTRRVLEFSRYCGAKRLLFVSSGAVYGQQPAGVTHIAEDYVAQTEDIADSAYGNGKRAAEDLCASAHARKELTIPIARCFAFVGPYLPLNRHFAIGNFLRDALSGGPVIVRGDGQAFRSYMYAADLAAWLWTILVFGDSCRPYNVGSDQAISIKEVAHSVAQLAGCAVEVQASSVPDTPPQRSYYVPAIGRARRELGLQVETDFFDAIERTFAWHQTRAPYRVAKKEIRHARC
jgi:nucleoside-diphosphate-sugar epimerase